MRSARRFVPAFLAAALLFGSAAAARANDLEELRRPRRWTSASGQSIVALFQSVEEDTVVLKLRNGSVIRIPLEKLSHDDVTLLHRTVLLNELPTEEDVAQVDKTPVVSVAEPAAPAADGVKSAAALADGRQAMPFVGTNRLVLGEKNVMYVKLPAADLEAMAAEGNPGLDRARFAVWVPGDFDPAKKWNVLVASQGDHGSSIDHLDKYLPALRASPGWIGVAADGWAGLNEDMSPILPEHDNWTLRYYTLRGGLLALSKAYPASVDWPLAFAGYGDGAQRSADLAALYMRSGRTVLGAFCAASADNRASAAFDEFRPPKSFRQLPFYFSIAREGEPDPEDVAQTVKSMKATGFRRMKLVPFQGENDAIDTASVTEALEWFLSLAVSGTMGVRGSFPQRYVPGGAGATKTAPAPRATVTAGGRTFTGPTTAPHAPVTRTPAAAPNRPAGPADRTFTRPTYTRPGYTAPGNR
ncbi:MAG: hypothetical protein IJS32_08975 [Kiritimatiellae bacterium]|nr:hypothetical protein [Kiritimatiellia bacterium]